MRERVGIVLAAIIVVLALAGCGSDADSGAQDATGAPPPTAAFAPRAALLAAADLPGYTEVESSPGDGICGFRLVERAANGGRITFENADRSLLVEHLVLLFRGDADEAIDDFVAAVKGCESGTVGDYTLSYAIVPLEGVDSDRTVGVEATSTDGSPPLSSLTILALDSQEVSSVAVVSTQRSPNAAAIRAARIALKRLQRARRAASR